MKNSLKSILPLLAAGMLFDPNSSNPFNSPKRRKNFEPETPEQESLRVEKYYSNKNLKVFEYGDVTIWALNKKNADRKAKKQGLI